MGEAGGVEGGVHGSGVEEVVEEPACEPVEGRVEVVEGGAADPEAAAVVAEEILFEGDEFGGGGGGAIRDGVLNVEVEPGVACLAETADWEVGLGSVGHSTGDDGAVLE